MSIRNDLSIDWNASPRIITIAKNGAASESISLQDLIDTLRFIEYQVDTQAYPYLIDSFGKQALGGGVKVGITLVLKNAKLAFEARPPSTFVQCNISGGNLVAVDDVGDDMDPVQTTDYTQIIRTSSSSATLQELLDIQHSSFSEAVTIDVIMGSSGTAYPKGTSRDPVNNLADAKVIAAARGFCCINIMGNFTFETTDNIDGFRIHGQGYNISLITVIAGCSTEFTEIEQCMLTGALDGTVRLFKVCMFAVTGFLGIADQCILAGDVGLAGGPSDNVNLVYCSSGVSGVIPEIDMNGDGPGLAFRQWSGGILLKNKSGNSSVTVDFVSGHLKLTSTVTAGKIAARGMFWISQNDATGITLVVKGSSENMPKDIWGALRLDHIIVGSTGEAVGLLWDEAGGKRVLDKVAFQEIFYKADNVTEVMRFNLFDKDGNPSVVNVYERVRV